MPSFSLAGEPFWTLPAADPLVEPEVNSSALRAFYQHLDKFNIDRNMSHHNLDTQMSSLERSRAEEQIGLSWRTWAYSSTLLAGILSLAIAITTLMQPNELTTAQIIWLAVSGMTVGVGIIGLSKVRTGGSRRRIGGGMLLETNGDIELQEL